MPSEAAGTARPCHRFRLPLARLRSGASFFRGATRAHTRRLENVDSIKESLDALHDQCRLVGLQLRTYTCDSNGLASLATDHVRSGMKDAVDFQISHVDAATFIQANVGSGAKVLIVTNDDFGETVASMSKDIAAAKLNILCFLLSGKRRCELSSSRKHRIGQARGHLIRS